MNKKYCDSQDDCKLLKNAVTQYNQVVKQNQDLQKEIKWYKEQMGKDNQYVIKLEEANMLLEQDVETLKMQVEALQDALCRKEAKKNEN